LTKAPGSTPVIKSLPSEAQDLRTLLDDNSEHQQKLHAAPALA